MRSSRNGQKNKPPNGGGSVRVKIVFRAAGTVSVYRNDRDQNKRLYMFYMRR
nr:MAG TPA: hypothetical protein [Caudoviricetes sp.]